MSFPGVDLDVATAYRSRLAARLDAGHPGVRTVFDDWCAHVRRHHGAVLESTDGSATDGGGVPARELVLDALTFDAAVDALRRAVETACDLQVETPAEGIDRTPAHEAVDVSFGEGHDVDPAALAAVDGDDLRLLYERIVPATTRKVFGEYYTPPALAALGVEAVAARLDDFDGAPVLDPGCGAGAFLTAALRRKRPALAGEGTVPDGRQAGTGGDPVTTLDRLTESVVGIDVNPVAVAAARAAYLLTLLPLVRTADVDHVRVPVFLGDALGLSDATTTGMEGEVGALVGNPPWIPWERLPERQKERLRAGPVDRLGLFEREGATARLGHANDDLSLPFVWTCLDRYLVDGGAAAFVLKRDHLRGPAGRLLRSGRVGSRPLAVEHVHDFAATSPFDGVDAAAALCVFRLGAADGTPTELGRDAPAATTGNGSVPTTVWEPADGEPKPAFGTLDRLRTTHRRTETALVPVTADDPAGPWQRADADRAALGECAYRIRHGLKDDAKAVFSVDEGVLAEVEPTHVYPYLRSKHLVKWGLFGHDHFLVPQRRAGEDNEAELAREAPRTYDYLRRHRERLEARSSSWFDAGPFYSLFGLGPYTWAPYKVVWCRLGFKPHFAVVSTVDDGELGRTPVVPGDHCMFVACDDEREAHYLCALLNATPYQRSLRDLAGDGKAGLSKSVVSSLALPAWDATERQDRLAALSLAAHDIVPDYVDRPKRAYNQLSIPELAAIEREIDAVVARFLDDRV
jgi:hypothetical protein